MSVGEYKMDIVRVHSFLACSAKKTSKTWFSFLYQASHFVDSKKSCSVNDKTLADKSCVSCWIRATKNAKKIPIRIMIIYFETLFAVFISRVG